MTLSTALLTKKRLTELDIAKGIAIALVVFGHITARSYPLGNEWYKILREIIYMFHMPLFMCLCGIVMFYGYKSIDNVSEYLAFVNKKFFRLMPPYLVFGILIFIGKWTLQSVLYIDNPVRHLSDISWVFVAPTRSVAAFLWFIYVLFLYYLTIPLLFKLCRENITVLLFFSFLFQFIHLTDYFALHRFAEYSFIFCFGAWVGMNYKTCVKFFDRYWIVLSLLFIGALCMVVFIPIPKFIMGLCSAISIISLARNWPRLYKSSVFQILGKYVFTIYLLNTICIGLVKAVLWKFFKWDFENFLIYIPILTAAGLGGPILLKKYIFRHVPLVDKLTY